MIFKEIDFILFIDSQVRELKSLIKLKEKLENRGLQGVILPLHYNRYYYAISFKPRIIITPFFYNTNDGNYNLYKKLNRSTLFLNLHSEQLHNELTKEILLPKDNIAKEIFHISWGKDFAEDLIQSGVNRSKIFITGSVRNDGVFEFSQNQTSNDNNILIPSSFGLTMMPQAYIDNIKRKDSPTLIDFQIDFMRKSRDLFLKIIYDCSVKYPQKHFLIRPHPHVDVNKYIETFNSVNKLNKLPQNISIKREGSIQDFFLLGQKVITWHSTSILEAVIMKKEVAILAPLDFPASFKLDYFKYLMILKDKVDVSEFIENGSASLPMEEYLSSKFYRIDGQAADRIAEVVKIVLSKNQENKRRLQKKEILPIILKIIFRDLPKSILLSLHLLDKINRNYKGMIEDNVAILKEGSYNKAEHISFVKEPKPEGNYLIPFNNEGSNK